MLHFDTSVLVDRLLFIKKISLDVYDFLIIRILIWLTLISQLFTAAMTLIYFLIEFNMNFFDQYAAIFFGFVYVSINYKYYTI